MQGLLLPRETLSKLYPLADLSSCPSYFSAIQTDTRSLQAGSLFVALKGERHNGHDYLQQAVNKGATAAIVSQKTNTSIPTIPVADTTAAFGAISAAYFHSQATHTKRIGITGSNGKTTIKEFLYNILNEQYATLANPGNFNNEIGVPKSLLNWQGESHIVIEMGARQPGDIDYLAKLVKPHIGILSNAQSAHLGIFGSQECIVQTKGELLAQLPTNGAAIIDKNSPWLGQWEQQSNAPIYTVAPLKQQCDSFLQWGYEHGKTILSHRNQIIEVELPISGEHSAYNAALSTTAALLCGVTLQTCIQGLQKHIENTHRMQWLQCGQAWILDDCYNANPASFKAGINSLMEKEIGHCMVIMGDMAELGHSSAVLHQEVALHALKCGVKNLWTIGEMSIAAHHFFKQNGGTARHFDTIASLKRAFQQQCQHTCTILVKGSRSNQLEQLLE